MKLEAILTEGCCFSPSVSKLSGRSRGAILQEGKREIEISRHGDGPLDPDAKARDVMFIRLGLRPV